MSKSSQNKHSTVKQTFSTLQKEFNANRKKLLRLSLISFALTIISLGIVGTKLFYPFHFIIGITIYLISFVPLIKRIYLSKQAWKKYQAYTWSANFFKKERWRLFIVVLFIILTTAFFWLRPLDEKPFEDFTNQEISQIVKDDLYQSVTAMDYLETTGNELLTLLSSDEANANVNADITEAFNNFLKAVSFSESLTERHRYFHTIPYSIWDDRETSFLISYSLYAKKYEIVHRIMEAVSGSEFKKKVLNQYIPEFNRNNIQKEMITRFYEPKTRLRLTGGYLYLNIFADSTNSNNEAYEMLVNKSEGSYDYLKSNFISTIFSSGEIAVDSVEQKMFDTWFPIQKTVASAMGRAIITTRGKDGLIENEQIIEMQKVMLPGDIMLQRRNWHISNVGIPGFWTHAALYTGDLKTMDTYFASEFPFQNHASFSEYLASDFPEVYAKYNQPDAQGFLPSTLEAIEAGVISQSLPASANADFVVVLRSKLDKRDVLLALQRAFEHFGKPYDFDFDFDTRDALVCSELVYDAYFPKEPEKKGIKFTTSLVNGRKMVSPLDIANKYASDKNAGTTALDFVYFIGSDEETKATHILTEADFTDSITWSKFSFLQE